MTRQVIIDCHKIRSLDDVHDLIAELPDVPEWYGRNLDALTDALDTMIEQPVEVRVLNASALKKKLGRRYEALMVALRDAVENTKSESDRPVVTLVMEGPDPMQEVV